MTHPVLTALGSARIVPVVVLEDGAHALGLADALVAGGLPVAEVTFRTEAAEGAIRAIAARGDVLVGAGTVRTAEQVERAVDAGARFVVSPGTSRAVIERCQALDVPVIPGAVTASEVMMACDLGVSTVKFFPAQANGGAKAVAALAAPFKDVGFVPTGGVGLSNLHEYLSLPSVVAVGGSWMVPTRAIADGDVAAVQSLVEEAVAAAAPKEDRS